MAASGRHLKKEPRRSLTEPRDSVRAALPSRETRLCIERSGGLKPAARPPIRARGFTLIELIVAITVGAIVSGTAGMLILNASKQRSEVAARGELTDVGSAALECVVRYVREIRQDENYPAGPTPDLQGNAHVTLADVSELRFDNYGFRLNAGALEITNDTAVNWHKLAGDVSGLTFSYYGWTTAVEAPTALTSTPLSASDRAAIRRVSVRIDLARGTETARVQTSIYLRNFLNEVANAP